VSEHGVRDLILALPDDLGTATWALLLVLHAETLRSSRDSSTHYGVLARRPFRTRLRLPIPRRGSHGQFAEHATLVALPRC
jgi:hypothetical protein